MALQEKTPRRVILISGHYLRSKRQAGFHHLARAYWRLGWDVTFVTAPISLLSRLRGDFRFEYPVAAEANRPIRVNERLTSFVLMTTLHPINLRSSLINAIARPLLGRYAKTNLGPLADFLGRSDLVVFESSAALLLVDRVRLLAPRARLVYRVSDDLRTLGLHPLVLDAEQRVLATFDLVSTPSRFIYDALAGRGRVELQGHAIDKQVFDQPCESPYRGGPNAIHVGIARGFNYESLATAARVAPDMTFHIIGPEPRRATSENVVFYGELPFEATVPFLKHADIGLDFIARREGVESFTDSLKIIQYSYCLLPILRPSYLHSDRPNACYYEPGDERSTARAIAEARAMPHEASFADGIPSWEELARSFATEPP